MIAKYLRMAASAVTALSLTVAVPGGVWAQPQPPSNVPSTTPIKHLVVIFQENVSFDHYFATYPYAQNPPGEPKFEASENTPSVNNLLTAGLLTDNPNSTQPFRLDPITGNNTCDENHSYGPEQQAFDKGLMDNFPAATGSGNGTVSASTPPLPGQVVGTSLLEPGQTGYCYDAGLGNGLVMGYYDGNTVTAYWNYAQHFAMSDNSFSTNFGPSAVGAINLISGNTGVATLVSKTPAGATASSNGDIANAATTGALIGDARPGYDDCVLSNPKLQTTTMVTMTGTTIGDLLNERGLTWGWFMGGFAPTATSGRGGVGATGVDEFGTTRPLAYCGSAGTGLYGYGAGPLPDNITTVGDYIPHHEPFEYYLQDSNVQHLPPSSPSMIGKTDQAMHQYDIAAFYTALSAGNLPTVSFLKAPAYADGHPGYSDPLDEQKFVVHVVNSIMGSPDWKDTAIVILYDDSDGWYDHVMDPVVSQSNTIEHNGVYDDNLAGPGSCGTTPAGGLAGRCGYGPRQPLLVISPYAKQNYVDHQITDQSSVIRFIEDNFLDSARIGDGSTDARAGQLNNMFDFTQTLSGNDNALLLNETTGKPVSLK